MSTLAANDPKLCWDEANEKWVKCKPPSKSTRRGTGPPPPPLAKCCIPNCCIDCDYLLAFKQCLKNLETVQFPVGSGYELRTFSVVDLQNLLDPQYADPYYTPCRFWFFRNGSTAIAVGGAPPGLNVFSATFYDQLTQQWTQGTCFNDPAQVTNGNVAMVVGQFKVQCLTLTGANTPECVDIGICWTLRWVDNGNGTYSPIFDPLKLCTQPNVVVDKIALTDCFACGGPFPPPCVPTAVFNKIYYQGTLIQVPTGGFGPQLEIGNKYDVNFTLDFPLSCCVGDYNITVNAPFPPFAPLPGFNPVINTPTIPIDCTVLTTPGVYILDFTITTSTCGVFPIQVQVEAVV